MKQIAWAKAAKIVLPAAGAVAAFCVGVGCAFGGVFGPLTGAAGGQPAAIDAMQAVPDEAPAGAPGAARTGDVLVRINNGAVEWTAGSFRLPTPMPRPPSGKSIHRPKRHWKAAETPCRRSFPLRRPPCRFPPAGRPRPRPRPRPPPPAVEAAAHLPRPPAAEAASLQHPPAATARTLAGRAIFWIEKKGALQKGDLRRALSLLFQASVLCFVHRLQPFVRAVFSRHLNGKMAEPAIRRRAVPVLYACGNVDAVAGAHFHRLPAPLLIISPSADTDEDLPAALVGMVHMPVVPAARFKGDIENTHLFFGYRRKIALPDKILRKAVVGRADGEQNRILILFLFREPRLCFVPHVLCQPEYRPRLGQPA